MTINLNKTIQVVSSNYINNQLVTTFIDNLFVLFEQEGVSLYNKRNVIKSFVVDPNDEILSQVVVKRYKRPMYFQRLVYSFFKKSKAERSFHNARILRERGISTPREIAYVEKWRGGLFEYGYYISASDMAFPIVDKLPNEGEFDKKMADCFAAFVAELHQKGLLHHDLNSTNVLYHLCDNKSGYWFSLIDINRMKIYSEGKTPSRKECFLNMTRFTGNMELFEYVAKSYIECRNWVMVRSLKEVMNIKKRHDAAYRRRKDNFLRVLFKKKR